MRAIILAAGEGTRMRPLTLETPKPLLLIKGRPILDYVFDALPDEVSEVIVVVRYLGDKIKKFLGKEYRGKKISYVEGSEKGTAYSFLAAKERIREGERFLVMYGDEFPRKKNIIECLRYPRSISVFESPRPEATGVVLLDKKGAIREIEEKPKQPKSNIGVGGVMVLDADIFRYKPFPNEKGEYYLTSLLDQYVRDCEVYGVLAENFIGDITTPEDLERVEGMVSRLIPP